MLFYDNYQNENIFIMNIIQNSSLSSLDSKLYIKNNLNFNIIF